jgi:hypothetical protein
MGSTHSSENLFARIFSHSTDKPHVTHSPNHSTIYGWTIRFQHAIPTCVWSYWYSDATSIYQYLHPNRQIPFLSTLYLPGLSHLRNDLIQHALFWSPIPTKLLYDIPKFNKKPGEYPNNHVITFHLWCYSNSLMDGSIRLIILQITLIGLEEKWYIELPRNSFVDFNSLSMAFPTHFQLPI